MSFLQSFRNFVELICEVLEFVIFADANASVIVSTLKLTKESSYRNQRSIDAVRQLYDGGEKDEHKNQENNDHLGKVGIEDFIRNEFPAQVRVDHVEDTHDVAVLLIEGVYEQNTADEDEAEGDDEHIYAKLHLFEGLNEKVSKFAAYFFFRS